MLFLFFPLLKNASFSLWEGGPVMKNCPFTRYEAAYVSELWIFYDYVSLFQFQRETEEEEQSV